MELFQVDITGFRKFTEKAEFKTRGKVLAILGANEAGKSSLLKALVHLNNTEPFEPHEKSTGTDGERIEIKAKFMLSDDDRKAARVPRARWYTITKHADGRRTFWIEPRPDDRDYSHRTKMHKEIVKIEAKSNAVSILADQDEALLKTTKQFLSSISDRKSDLSDVEKGTLSDISTRWRSALNEESPQYLRSVSDSLNEAIALESAKSVTLTAGDVLGARRPEFLFFGGDERYIKSSYA